MLLELLSDFQISIPELGRVEATHAARRAADLEQHARADRGAQAPLPVPVARLPRARARARDRPLHAPELDEDVARKLVEVVAMVRDLDLKKPPSIAESIDWARALLLLGADDIDGRRFRDTMSIIVKHRTDLDVVAERVGVKLGLTLRCRRPPAAEGRAHGGAAPTVAPRGDRRAAPRVRRGAARRGRRHRHRASCSTPSRCSRDRLDRARRLPRGAGRDARQVPGGPAHLRARLRPLLLPRRRAGRRARGRHARRRRRWTAGRRRARPRDAAPARSPQALRDGDGGAHARPRAPGDRRVRPPGRGLGRHRRRRPAHPPRARPARRAPARPAARRPAPRRPAARGASAASRRCCAASSSAARSSAPSRCRPSRPLNELDRALPSGPLQDLAAVHRVVAQLKRRLKTQGQEQPRRKRHAHVDVRRTMRASLETGGVPVDLRYKPVRPRRPGDLRAVRRLDERHERVASSSSASCTRCTTRSARCARSSSSSASARSPTSSSASATSRPSPRRSAATPASPTSRGYTDYGRVWSEFARRSSRTTCTRARR